VRGICRSAAEAFDIPLSGDREGVITGRRYRGSLHLDPYEVDLLQ
jgi:hypothetical protein